MTQWQRELKDIFEKKNIEAEKIQQNMNIAETQFMQFIVQIAEPAFEELSKELIKYHQRPNIMGDHRTHIGIAVGDMGIQEKKSSSFTYGFHCLMRLKQHVPS